MEGRLGHPHKNRRIFFTGQFTIGDIVIPPSGS
jgi:hypothetical protein